MKNLNNIMCLDIFLSKANDDAYRKVMSEVAVSKIKPHPLMCWDIAAPRSQNGVAKEPEPVPVLEERKF